MEKLHFSHMSGDELVMLNDEGVEFQISIDETLRSAIRRIPSSMKPDQALPSPREIQEWVRDGKSIIEICEASGAPEEYVSKFAQPVLDELNHIVESAKAVRISLAGDRFSDITQIEFGSLISSRLQAAGAADPIWTSQRLDLGSWQLRVDFEIEGGRGTAIWAFDPRKLVLTPENEAALSLSSTESLHSTLIPKLKPVSSTATPLTPKPAQAMAELVKPSSSIQQTIATENLKSNLVSNDEQISAHEKTNYSDEPEKKSHLSVVKTEEHLPVEGPDEHQPSDAPATSDLLSEIRSKRASESVRETERPSESELRQPGANRPLIPVEEPSPVTTSIRVIPESQEVSTTGIHERAEDSQLPAIEPEDEVAADAAPNLEEPESGAKVQETHGSTKPDTKKGRPGIPSWDEIVFGTKTDD